ncbi:hypothetical protein VQ042_25095 [Aurantimonas sp. A2-1-M11]|uniref:hypothetical protein n=1 Tax=Aurantimonas sp. A2-1-M11 TaxID=3113712 RepID=UPI002F929D30
MKADQLMQIRDEISAPLMAKIAGNVEAEHGAVIQAATQLEQFGSMGGSTREKAEAEIVRMMRRFNDTQDDSLGRWPVSTFMSDRDKRADRLRAALAACIAAHITGRYEPMVAATEAARRRAR